jgi:hypothetical protein
MRTKTLLLTAAVTAAGVATSMAQVFSVNAVGYVNTTLKPKYNLISNPLRASNNTIGELFKNIEGGVPDGLQVYKFNGTGFTTATYDAIDAAFGPPAAASQTVLPGEGVFVNVPGTADKKLTFVGEVEQGNLVNPIPAGLSIRSSQVPQEGTVTALGMPAGSDGDQIYQFNSTTQGYTTATFDGIDNNWDKVITLKVGEALFLKRKTAANWTRTFTVN